MTGRKILAASSALLVASALVLGGFVWWKLQPWTNLQPLPAALTALDSPEGKRLLQNATAFDDYGPLDEAFEPQRLVSFCGVASAVTVLNAMGHETLTQDSFFNDDTDAVRTRFQVMLGGMSLPELAGLLEAHGAEVVTRHASDTTVEELREAVEHNLAQRGDFLLVNYQREPLGQARVGHISPLAAYDRDSDQALILDTAAHKYPPTWVSLDSLFTAMNTVDPASGKTRGFVEVRPGVPSRGAASH